MRYGDYLEEAVFKPLGMCDTGFFVPEEKQHRLADCYRSTGQGDMKPFTGDNLFVSYRMQGRPAFESGGAGLVSTIDDSGQAVAWPFLFISYYFIGENSRKKTGHREI